MNCPLGQHEMTELAPGGFWCERDNTLAFVALGAQLPEAADIHPDRGSPWPEQDDAPHDS